MSIIVTASNVVFRHAAQLVFGKVFFTLSAAIPRSAACISKLSLFGTVIFRTQRSKSIVLTGPFALIIV
jgi:hypothetical protein